MVRALRASSPVEAAWRVLAPLLVLILLATAEAAAPFAVAADGPAADAAAMRQRQLRIEATMLRADKQVKRLQQQRKHHARHLRAAKHKLERAIDRRDRSRATLARVDQRVERGERVLARAVHVRPNPSGRQVTDKPALRKRLRALDRRVDTIERKVRKLERKVEQARKQKQARWTKVGRARIEARKAARDRAEAKLGAAISSMIEQAKARADAHLHLSSGSRFRKPLRGRVTQPYGCTGYRVNPRRGRCAHFHDGLDIAAPRGSLVRAAADGYVAYVGRNPWDTGKRSFVVIIGHARGYHSVYGHLQPSRLVRAGQRVDAGDRIGRVGTTGRTSGPHVHWEVRRDGRDVNPRARR